MKRSLEDEIELTREAMVQAAVKEGLTASETISLSAKLDSLMNQFDMYKTKNCPQDCFTHFYDYGSMQ